MYLSVVSASILMWVTLIREAFGKSFERLDTTKYFEILQCNARKKKKDSYPTFSCLSIIRLLKD